MTDKLQLKKELVHLFGEEAVQIAVAQEVIARRFALKEPIELRKALMAFEATKTIEEQQEFVDGMDKELKRAFICATLCDTATKALQEIAVQAIDDRRSGRAVLPSRIERPSAPPKKPVYLKPLNRKRS